MKIHGLLSQSTSDTIRRPQPPPSKPGAAWKRGIAGAGRLSRHLIGAIPGGVLGRFDLRAALVSEDADEAAHGVLLPGGAPGAVHCPSGWKERKHGPPGSSRSVAEAQPAAGESDADVLRAGVPTAPLGSGNGPGIRRFRTSHRGPSGGCAAAVGAGRVECGRSARGRPAASGGPSLGAIGKGIREPVPTS
jgi:hypothetical protein